MEKLVVTVLMLTLTLRIFNKKNHDGFSLLELLSSNRSTKPDSLLVKESNGLFIPRIINDGIDPETLGDVVEEKKVICEE
mgnify:CR=1 FL=1